jgi:hypothetical protein
MKVGVLPIPGMFGNDDARTNVVAAIAITVIEDRQGIEVGLSDEDLLAWRGIDHLTGAAMIDRVCEKRNQPIDFDVEVIGKGSFAAKQIANHAER